MTLRRSLFVSVFGTYAAFAVQIASSIVVARLLSPREMGVWSIAQGAIFISATLRDFGAGDYLVRSGEINKAAIGRVFALMLSISLACAGLLWASRGFIGSYFHEPALVGLIGLCTVSYLFMPLGLGALVTLEREYAFATLHAMQLAAVIAGSGVAILLAWHGFSYYSLAWGQLCQAAMLLCLRAIARPQAVFCKPIFNGWSQILHFGIFSTLNAAVGQISAQSVTAILGRRLGLGNLGLYDRAQSMTYYISNGLTFPAMQVLYVGLARAKDSPREFASLFLASVENLVGILWPAYALLAVLAQPVILVLYGPKWLQAAPLFSLTCCGGMMLAACYVHMRALTALGRIRAVFVIEACIMACRIGALLLLSSQGIFAAVAATVLPTALAVPLYWWAMRRHVALSWQQARPALLRAMAITGMTVLPAAALRLGQVPETLFMLCLALALGGASWIASLYLFRHPLKDEVSRVLAWAKSARRKTIADDGAMTLEPL